jgi:hypothetical protein
MGIQIVGQTDGWTRRHVDKERDGETDRQVAELMGRQTLGHTSSRIGRRTNRQMDKDTAEIQTDG